MVKACGKLQNNTSNYNYFTLDNSSIPFELVELTVLELTIHAKHEIKEVCQGFQRNF